MLLLSVLGCCGSEQIQDTSKDNLLFAGLAAGDAPNKNYIAGLVERDECAEVSPLLIFASQNPVSASGACYKQFCPNK